MPLSVLSSKYSIRSHTKGNARKDTRKDIWARSLSGSDIEEECTSEKFPNGKNDCRLAFPCINKRQILETMISPLPVCIPQTPLG